MALQKVLRGQSTINWLRGDDGVLNADGDDDGAVRSRPRGPSLIKTGDDLRRASQAYYEGGEELPLLLDAVLEEAERVELVAGGGRDSRPAMDDEEEVDALAPATATAAPADAGAEGLDHARASPSYPVEAGMADGSSADAEGAQTTPTQTEPPLTVPALTVPPPPERRLSTQVEDLTDSAVRPAGLAQGTPRSGGSAFNVFGFFRRDAMGKGGEGGEGGAPPRQPLATQPEEAGAPPAANGDASATASASGPVAESARGGRSAQQQQQQQQQRHGGPQASIDTDIMARAIAGHLGRGTGMVRHFL